MMRKLNGTSISYITNVDKTMNILVEEARIAAKQNDWSKLNQVLMATEVYAKCAGAERDRRVDIIRTIYESRMPQQKGLESCL